MKKIIFSDLDGTLLDFKTYSYKGSIEGLDIVKKASTPLILCSSKTRAEMEHYRKKLGNKDPFIVENGGAIFIPKGYFGFDFKLDEVRGKYKVIKLGIDHDKLIKVLKDIKYPLRPYHQMTAKELAKDSGLPLSQAKMAKKREFSESFKILGSKEKVFKEIRRHNLNYTTGGRYHSIIGDNDKGKAVKILIKLFKKKFGEVFSVGVGDSENDFDMLDAVDSGYLVQGVDKSYASNKYKKAKGVGPGGFNWVVKQLTL